MSVELVAHVDRPELRTESRLYEVWPEFLRHDRTVNENFDRLFELAPEFQFYAFEGDELLAQANALPVAWSGRLEPLGIDWALTAGLESEPTTLCAIQVMVAETARGRGLSAVMVRKMVELAAEHGLDAVIAPVRPTLKERYPLVPMERYLTWRRDDGLLFDPWLRTHERLGATLLGIAPESMRIEGPVADWEAWTGMAFPEDGDYVVPGALLPVRFEGGRGLYVEPNVWMRHPVPS
jgi:GNAT superfamily N-acetyltransferase